MRPLLGALFGLAVLSAAACGGSGSGDTNGTGGASVPPGSGGLTASGGSSGPSTGSGGAPAATGSGGAPGTGGNQTGTGGQAGPDASGGLTGASGGAAGPTGSGGAGTGGAPGTGGAAATAGAGGRSGDPGGSGVAGRSGTGGGAPPTGTGGGQSNPGGTSYPYVFSTFNDSAPGNTTLIVYTSNDALNFTLLSDTKFGGPTGTLRDPSIMKHTDGKFYIAFTTPPNAGCCGPESSFAIASSANLKDWTTVATVPSGVAGVKNTWAPEWFKDTDGTLYILANIDGKTYRYTAMDATLTKFSAGTWIGIGPGYIDTFIVNIDGTYHAFTKASTLYIEHATSTSIDGPWNFVGTGNWAGWGVHREAPALIKLANGTWRFYCDGGSAGHEQYSDSADVFKTWTPLKPLPGGVGAVTSHGTVIQGN